MNEEEEMEHKVEEILANIKPDESYTMSVSRMERLDIRVQRTSLVEMKHPGEDAELSWTPSGAIVWEDVQDFGREIPVEGEEDWVHLRFRVQR